MRKEKSWTRWEYEQVYAWMRRGVSIDWFAEHSNHSLYAIKAADYSYQAYSYEQSGWINRRRYNEFRHLQAIRGFIWDLPF